MAPDSIDVCVAQNAAVWHDPAASREAVRSTLDSDAPTPGSVVTLPETFSTGFTAEPSMADDGTTTAFLRKIADDFDVHVIAGLVRTDTETGRGTNTAVVCSPSKGEVGSYDKVHLFPLDVEAETFRPGSRVDSVDLAGVRVTPLVCYDLRFPETWRRAVGSEVFVLIANWPSKRMHHWRALLRARAIENQAFVVGVNRAGTDPKITYTGGSVVFNPDGEVVAEAGKEPTLLKTSLDLASLRAFRERLPFLPQSV
ncbi:MAG: nitrilase-related carbon-nitrogen hydrolase [Planctomycetota bacterium]